MTVTVEFKPSLQYQKAAKTGRCSLRQLRKIVVSRWPNVLLSPFKAFGRLSWPGEETVVKGMGISEPVQLVFYRMVWTADATGI